MYLHRSSHCANCKQPLSGGQCLMCKQYDSNKELAPLLSNYMNSSDLANAELKEKLRTTKAEVRVPQLLCVYVSYDSTADRTYATDVAAYLHDLEALKCLLEGLSPDQKLLVLSQGKAVYWAFFDKESYETTYSSQAIVEYLFNGLSSAQKLKLLTSTEVSKVFRTKAFRNDPSIREFIIKSLSNAHQIRLLSQPLESAPTQWVADLFCPSRQSREIQRLTDNKLNRLEGSLRTPIFTDETEDEPCETE
ncbi:uncharacterized protein [Watersipora subatra]|uniref:uncharacterized protein n=1 Tax=Watersipora subatra TaxID=2589382 RepID=UPI00355B1069